MKSTKTITLSLILLLILVPVDASASEEKTRAAEKAANDWLALVDSKQYKNSWNESASLFRNAISPSDWAKAVNAARSPLGRVVSRNLISANYTTTLPGAPDGEYVVLQFQSKFENKAKAIETITPMLDGDQWRVSGYYVR
ncbi:MAG: DUF4019 domain-containing protein [Planctomycetes bacterium]|nr:DUF4019 domain-containing protein [Planctomycetota bacterium]